MAAAAPIVRLENVEKFFASGFGRTYVLRQITMDVAEGEFVTLMGASGAGR